MLHVANFTPVDSYLICQTTPRICRPTSNFKQNCAHNILAFTPVRSTFEFPVTSDRDRHVKAFVVRAPIAVAAVRLIFSGHLR